MIDFNLLDYVSDERVEIFKKYINENPKNYALLKEMFDILKLYKMDTSSFYACGLFVLIDKNLVDYENIKLEFGEDVLKMLKKLNEVGFQQSSDENIEYVRNMFMAMVQDVRVLIILLAYNLYRAKHLDEMEEDEKSRFAKTIKDIYSPLSARLGLREIKNQLENISFKYYDPDMFNQLSQDDLLNKEERLKQIEITIKKIQEILKQSNIEGQVYGREKHLASVYNKLKQKASTLSQIYDLMAVRVIVNTVEECYIMLGKINSLFTIIPNRFKDYIAMPKPNGYKSIHTGVLSENNRPIEIQIRTKEMHHYNEYGVAAHWIYKEKGHKKSSYDQAFNWLKELIEGNKDLSSKDFVETVSRDMFTSEIFAQTPNGKIIRFPIGANCIDFAYAIHSDIGNRCVGAKINGKIVPIVTPLQNGDVCEIILGANNKGPSRDWLNLVKTTSARNKINMYFKKQFVEENIKNGKSAVENYLKSINLTLADFSSSEKIEFILNKLNLDSLEELYSLIGNGSLKAENIVNRVIPKKNDVKIKLFNEETSKKHTKNYILVGKQKDFMTRFAKCCSPVASDKIIGFLSMGRGVTVHRADCSNVKYLDANRLIDVEWDSNINDNFQVKFKVIYENKASISKVANCLEKLNIKTTSLELSPTNEHELIMGVVVKGQEDIEKIINRVSSLQDVSRCTRI